MPLLDGFAVSGFRSYRPMQYFGPLGHLNVIAGRNNSGKSNAIRFLKRFVGASVEVAGEPDIPADEPEEAEHSFAIGLHREKLIEIIGSRMQNPGVNLEVAVDAIFGDDAFKATDTGLVWIEFSTSKRGTPGQSQRVVNASGRQLQSVSEDREYLVGAAEGLSRGIAGQWGATRGNIETIVHNLRLVDLLPPVEVVEATRQVEPHNETVELIKTIDDWRDPPQGRGSAQAEAKYEALNLLLRRVLDDDSAVIRIPGGDSLVVRTDRRNLSLSNLGTGIHQLLHIATAATRYSGRVVCIEEPEVHMHPAMQRVLLEYLNRDGSNQYLITTHSAAFLDHRHATVFSTSLNADGDSVVARAAKPNDLAELSQDLGYRASDLIQSNYVIWVEGPSDRIYLTFWLSRTAPHLVEGVHYSVMFYGGSLLSHLRGDDEDEVEVDVSEFVNLCRLNRNFTLMVDSDKRSPGRQLATSKNVAIDQVKTQPRAQVWITDGNTVENYVPVDLFRSAVESCFRSRRARWTGRNWENPLGGMSRGKVRIARKVVSLWQQDRPIEGPLAGRLAVLIGAIERCQTLEGRS